jgi:hypothetical protein
MSELNVGKLVVSQGIIPPSVATQNRPVSPTVGSIIYNISLQLWEQWTGSSWIPVSGASINATGGIISYSSGYKIHTFTGNGTFSVSGSGVVEYLIVAGGGSGGSGEANPAGDSPGGGGAGGILYGNISLTPQTYVVTVGAGGGAVTGTSQNGINGSNSSALGLTAIGGGFGGREEGPGGNGGSGGGGGGSCTSGRKSGGAGTTGQGNRGGTGGDAGCSRRAGAGGGGAGMPGEDERGNLGGNGGIGIFYSISGKSEYYAGGGGGGNSANVAGLPGQGGLGGGGNGGTSPSGPGTNGVANTGGGGGATGSGTSLQNGLGGSGIVIIRYSIF